MGDEDVERAKAQILTALEGLAPLTQRRILERAARQQDRREKLVKERRRVVVAVDAINAELRVWMARRLRSYGIKGNQSSPTEIETLLMLMTDTLVSEAVNPSGAFAAEPTGVAFVDELVELAKAKSLKRWLAWGEKWKQSSYARMACGHKLAAALMLTEAPEDSEVVSPWGAWSLYVPDGILESNISEEAWERARRAVDEWTAKGVSEGEVDLDARPGEKVIAKSTVVRIWCEGSEPVAFVIRMPRGYVVMGVSSTRQSVADAMVRNYVKGVCLALDRDHETHRKGDWGPRPQGRRPGVSPQPGADYVLGTPVAIDLRDEVRRILAGGPRPEGRGHRPQVQFLVRGHWRNQACGPGRQDRRHILIEPFWKGPEEARVLLRPHRLRTDDASDKEGGQG